MENKTMMKLLIGTEAVFFLSLIMGFVYLAFVAGYEPAHLQALNIGTTGVFTVVLVASSGSCWLAEKSYKKNNVTGLKVWLVITILLGGIFLWGQGSEYLSLIHKQITISSSLFGTSFYTLTGFHGLHVLIGLFIFFILLIMAVLKDFDKPHSTLVTCAGMYWHFVDIVWLVVFMVVYISPRVHLLK